MSKCKCEINYSISPFMTAHKIVCPECKAIHYIDVAPIDWKKIFDKENKK